ncbi:hypothetical protein [Serratia quinivorans]|uniref:hypothetical protein n=1 Tax=Serratia quinivorans TaxID=137545 RepID=UPI0039823E37
MKKLLIVIALLGLAGCKPGAEKATEIGQKEISSAMRDPDSSKFRYVRFIQKEESEDGTVKGVVCGQVNAKNAFGAYPGFTPFIMELTMKPKGFFSKGVTYSVPNQTIYSDSEQFDAVSYKKICGSDE